MKYCIVITDGASGWALPEQGNRTCLEAANTPHLDAMAREGRIGLANTVPEGMEPSSACACMSVLGYDPVVYYRGRSAIEAKSMGIPIAGDEIVFRCNLVAVKDGKMASYSAGHITTAEAKELIAALDKELGSNTVRFYPGISYRHIIKLKGQKEALEAGCTAPHDIANQPVVGYLPKGKGAEILRDLMKRSEAVLRNHPVNLARKARGETPATTIWLFWGSGQIPEMPSFKDVYGISAAMTSGVDLLKGLAQMMQMDILEIPGTTDNIDNDYAAQAVGALKALENHDMVVIHIEAPDESGHAGSSKDKIDAIVNIDREVIGRLRSSKKDGLRVLVMPDHPTPVQIRTHAAEPVPILMWGPGFTPNGGKRLTEIEGKGTGFFIDKGCNIMRAFFMQDNDTGKHEAN